MPRLFICLVGGRGGANRSAKREVGKGSGAGTGGGTAALELARERTVGAALAGGLPASRTAGALWREASLDLTGLEDVTGGSFFTSLSVGERGAFDEEDLPLEIVV